MTKLIDSYGRRLDYLRVSVTDRCNLRCIYCMPPEGAELKKHEDILTYDEILRIVTIMAKLGVRNIKVTGGEPLIREGFPLFFQQLKTIPGIEKITLTTSGILLGAYLDEVSAKGYTLPDGINISLDAIDNALYKRITQCDNVRESNAGPAAILKNIDRLLEKKILVKINCVPVLSVNDKEITKIAALAKDKKIIVRFIELKPVGTASNLRSLSGAQAASRVESAYGTLVRYTGIKGNGPAVYYSIEGFAGKIGFVNAVSHGFCETCNRMRLTPEGLLKPCLSNDLSLDLRKLIRSGNNDDELIKYIKEIVEKKPGFQSISRIYGTPKSYPSYY